VRLHAAALLQNSSCRGSGNALPSDVHVAAYFFAISATFVQSAQCNPATRDGGCVCCNQITEQFPHFRFCTIFFLQHGFVS